MTSVALQARSTSNMQRWRILRIRAEEYIFQNVGSGQFLARNGNNVLMSNAISTASRWNIRRLTMVIDVMYDQAFVDRHGGRDGMERHLNSVIHGSTSQGNSISSVMLQRYGVHVQFNVRSTVFASFPYTQNCQLINDRNFTCNNYQSIEMHGSFNCQHWNVLPSGFIIANCEGGGHHKSSRHGMLWNLPTERMPIINSIQASLLFSGHRTCAVNNDGNHVFTVAGWARNRNRGTSMTVHMAARADQSVERYRTLVLHEMLHLFEAPDHSNDSCIMNNGAELIHSLHVCTTCNSTIRRYTHRLFNHR